MICEKCDGSGLIWVERCYPTQMRCSCQPAPPMVVTTANVSAQFVAFNDPASPAPATPHTSPRDSKP